MKFFASRQDLLVLELGSKTARWTYFQDKTSGRAETPASETARDKIRIKRDLPASPSPAVLIIKRDELLTKILSLPSANSHELARIVAFTLPQEMPYHVSEIVYRFDALGVNREGFTQVRVVWMLKKNIDEKLRFARELGLETDEILASDQALLFYYLKLCEAHPALRARELILNLEAEEAEMVACDGPKILFSYLMKTGVRAWSENLPEFLRVVKETLADFKKETGETAASLAITGIPAIPAGLPDSLAKELGLPVSVLPQPAGRGAVNIPAVHAGACFYESFQPASFLPEGVRKSRLEGRSREARRSATLCAGLFMALTLAGLYCHFLGLSATREKLLKEYSRMNVSTKPLLRAAAQIELLGRIESEKTAVLDLLGALPALVPPRIFLTHIEYEREEGLRLRGTGESNQSITELMKALKSIPRLESTEFDFSRRKIEGGKEYFEFQIRSKIST